MLFSRRPSLRIVMILVIALFALHWTFFGPRIPRPRPDEWNSMSWSKPHGPPHHDHAAAHDDHRNPIARPHDADKAAPGDDESVFKPIPPKANASPTVSHVVGKPSKSPLPCATAEGIDDIVLIIKTGATEAVEKLPIHFNTTMECFPHVLIFSDFGETMDGHVIHDALSDVSEEIRLQDKDFELWRRLHEKGRADLRPDELSTAHKLADPAAGTGNPESGGWRLDKFKNLPMLGKTLELKPDRKWYIFTDADTFVSWSNMVEWTKKMDHTEQLYAGSAAVISDQIFGHGGSGYLLSAATIKAGAKLYAEQQKKWDEFASSHWAGDCVLATALETDLDIKLFWAFPMIQGGDPAIMDFSEIGYDKKVWCFPAMTYHHLSPENIEAMWEFEQEWTSSELGKKEPMRHGDIFKQWLLPKLKTKSEIREWSDWDNHAKDVVEDAEVNDTAGCRAKCEGNSTCMEYSYSKGICKTYDKISLGTADTDKLGIDSGWMMNRINNFVNDFDHCDGGETEGKWIIP
ncbi:Hypothetical protein R9X50_00247700 [Acrodontium crateriforme]|uniref:Glycosyltransferase family 31 protein n=1 Tax=Acrodontium crateriforme TaxID=150365 RepID=A0AAQ3M128_9PEZI|nr:Hypothetical protein R9X50_00247700 [Acrodontium crateriforme]